MPTDNITEKEKLKFIEEYVKKNNEKEIFHDFMHADRTRNWAMKIAKKEGFADLEVVEIAALLHDIGSPVDRKRHGEVGAELAEKFLSENNLLPPEKIAEVCQVIKFHNKNRGGEGKLLDILRDADILELFGAVGIMKSCAFHASRPFYNPANIKGETWGMSAKDFDQRFNGGKGAGEYIVDDFNFLISCYDDLATETAKQIALPMIEFTKKFLLEFEAEILSGREEN